MASTVLDANAIQALLSESRSRGDYAAVLREFIDSGEAGIIVDTQNGALAGRSTDKVMTGLNNARKATDDNGKLKLSGAENVRVIRQGKGDDAQVALVNLKVYEETNA